MFVEWLIIDRQANSRHWSRLSKQTAKWDMVSRLHSALTGVHARLLLYVTPRWHGSKDSLHMEENWQVRKAPNETPAVTEECEMPSISGNSEVSLGVLVPNCLVSKNRIGINFYSVCRPPSRQVLMWPQTHYAAEDDLGPLIILPSTSWVLGLQVYTVMPGFCGTGMEPNASRMLGKHSTNGDIPSSSLNLVLHDGQFARCFLESQCTQRWNDSQSWRDAPSETGVWHIFCLFSSYI